MDTVQAQMFEALFNQFSSPISVVKANAPDFTLTAFNEQYKKTTNRASDELIGRSVFDIYRPWDKESEHQFALLKEGLTKVITDKQQLNLPVLTFAPIAAGGERTWWQIQVTPILDANGQAEYLMCIIHNVTEREKINASVERSRHKENQLHEELQAVNEELMATNEELTATVEELNHAQENLYLLNNDLERRITIRTKELQASEKRLKSILNALPQIAWTNTVSGEVDFYNQRWYDYTGLTFEQTKAWGWKEVIHPDDLQYNLDTYRAILESGEPGEFEIRERGIDKVYRWHLVRIQPIINERGKIEHWIGTATEIDALKMLQQQKDDFISIASHELKTPITSLKASLQLIDKMKDKPSEVMLPKLISQSRKSMQRISTLVEDLLNVSRLQHGDLQLKKSTFYISELLNACCNPISLAGKHKVQILGDTTLKVYADEHRIDQVVVNLLNNAVKYAPDSESIVLSIERKDNMVKVSITDNGPGIPMDKVPHLFDRYYRVDSGGYQASGLGLGLYISAEIIKRHGGEIKAESKLGKGSTFWFTIPLGS